ncbi:hypothetical protein L0222_02380 [bacterium]|nr:hypothetical protein [bacterium]MCI0607029.1 hypothetical protein [bacterium]
MGGIVRPVSGSDVPAGGTLIDVGGAGERSAMPFWQGRLGYSRPLANDKTVAFGISAHYGKEDHRLPAFSKEINSSAIAGDFIVPLGKAITMQGEVFTGSNLDSFQGGINQGFELFTTNIESLDTTGGWVQISVTPPQSKNLSFHVAYGLDDPEEKGSASNVQRLCNSTWMGSIFYRFSKQFQTAIEYNHITTEYFQSGDNSADVVNFAVGFWF